MKKMICEICNSAHIRKIGDIFTCQDCGTEYDPESAKKLLKEVDVNTSITFEKDTFVINEKNNAEVKNNLNEIVKNDEDKYTLLNYLKMWYELIDGFKDVSFWFNVAVEFKNVDSYTTENYSHLCKQIVNSNKENFSINIKDYLKNQLKPFSLANYNKEEGIFSYRLKSFYPEKMSPEELFEKNNYIKKVDGIFLKACTDQIYCNDGVFDRYWFRKNVDDKYGFSWAKMHSQYDTWIELCESNQNYVSAFDTAKQGFFGTKIIRSSAEHIIKYSDFKQNVITLYNQIIDRHNKLVSFYNENFESMKTNYINLINNVTNMEKFFNLPLKYRTINCISKLIGYIKDGRVDSWKEAINLYEKEKFQDTVLYSLSTIQSILLDINNNIQNGVILLSEELVNISSEINNTNNLIKNCNDKLSMIQKDVRFNLIWNL